MSLGNITLKTGSIEQTLEDWGISAGTLQLQCGGDDTLQVKVQGPVDGASIFAPLQPVEIFDEAGHRRFYGIWLGPAYEASNPRELVTWVAAGPGFYLQKEPATQLRSFASDPTDFNSTLEFSETGRTLLGRDSTMTPMTTKDQIGLLLQKMVDLGYPIAFDLSLFPLVPLPDDAAQNVKMIDAIGRVLGWTPDVTNRWIYDRTGNPLLQFFGTLRPADALELGGLHSTPFTVRTAAITDLENWRGRARHDLLVSKVVFEVRTTVTLSGEVTDPDASTRSASRTFALKTLGISELANGAIGTEWITVEGPSFSFSPSGFSMVGPWTTDYNGQARVLHSSFAELLYEASWVVKGQRCAWDILPGELWNFTGADAAGADAFSVCQGVAHDLRSNTTSVTSGLPLQFGLNPRKARPRDGTRQRRAPTPDDYSETYGMDPSKDPDDPTNSDTEFITYAAQGDSSDNVTQSVKIGLKGVRKISTSPP